MTAARPDVPEPGRLTDLAAELERALARRMHLLAAALTAGGCLPYFFLLLGRPATPGGVAVLGVAVLGICAALASLWWVRPTRRYVAAIELLCWPVFLALLTLMAAQGGVGGTAVWWLPVAPLIALQGGATRSGVAMALLMVAGLATVHALGLHGDLRLPLLAPALDGTRRFLVVMISSTCSITVVALGVHWRHRLLRELSRALVAARAAGQARSRFIATMSHEIRTPLNGIVGAAEMLRSSALDEGQRKALHVLSHSTEALMALVNHVLDFSKLEAGRMETERVAFDLHELVQDAVELFAAQADTKGVALSAHVRRDVPVQVIGDPARLRQILHNLVANAVKFTASGEVHLRATTAAGADGRAWLRLSIRDTGIGMTVAQRGRLFEAFEQGDASTTRRFGGTGLGLAISRELAELLGGRFEVESEPGHGSTFTLYLPLTLAAEPAAPGSDPAAAVPPPPALAGRRIWLVSPTASLREGLLDVIAQAGGACEAFITLPMPAALAQARASGTDVVLVDDTALAPAGLEAAAWAARLDAAGLPGVLLRGLAGHPHGLRGSLTCIYKPARPAAVIDALRRVLAQAPSTGDEAPALPAAARDTPHPAATVHRALLVEDNPVNQLVACAMLESLGLRVTLAANGIEAIQQFSQPPDAFDFEIVLMDCQMPELDGMECTRRLREIEAREGRQRTPVVAMTADGQAEVGAECTAAGMDGFLAKPVRREQLQAVLERWAPARSG